MDAFDRQVLRMFDYPDDRIQTLVHDAPIYAPDADVLDICLREEAIKHLNRLTVLSGDTLELSFLALNYLDRLCSRAEVPRDLYLLAAATCWFLAAKFLSNKPLSLRRVLDLLADSSGDYAYPMSAASQMEALVLKHLEWRLAAVTSAQLLAHILPHFPVSDRALLVTKSRTILQLVGSDYNLLKFSALEVALSIVHCAFASELDLREEDWISGLEAVISKVGCIPLNSCIRLVLRRIVNCNTAIGG